MADTHETIADVVRKIRNEIAELRKVSPNVPSIAADWWEARADEIEAAHKREVEATAAKCCQLGRLAGYGASEIKHQQESVGDAAKLRETISTLRTALKEIRNDVLDMVMNYKSEDPDSYAHGLCLSIGGACDMALNSTKEFDNADK